MPSRTARGRVVAHEEGGRGLAAQRVVDEAGDRGAVARAGEAMRQAPVLERIGGGAAPRLDVGERLDGGGQAGGGGHVPVRMRTAKMIHITHSTTAPAMNSKPRRGTRLLVTCT